MANKFDAKNVKSKLGWSNAFDTDGAFPLDLRAWFGSLEDAQAAAQTAVEVGSSESKYFFGQQLYVFDGNACKTYLIQGDKSLKEIGAASSSIKIVKDQEAMLALEDIEAGQQVFREDTSTIWIYKGTDPSSLENWQETGGNSDVVWNGTENKVNFYALTEQQYTDGGKDENTLYFTSDTHRIYKGSSDVTASVILTNSIPEAASAIKNKLYINSTTFESKITADGVSFITVSPGYLTDGANWAEADSNKFATIGLIKKAFTSFLGEGNADEIILSTAEGGIKRSSKTIGGDTLTGDSNKLATEKAVVDAISWSTLE